MSPAKAAVVMNTPFLKAWFEKMFKNYSILYNFLNKF